MRDLISESLAGILQRPGRTVLTMLGTILGVGAFVSILGITATATGQIGKQFNILSQTTVTVTDAGTGQAQDKNNLAPVDFPQDADERVTKLNGTVAAGVYWTVPLKSPVIASSLAVTSKSPENAGELPVYASSPGLFDVMHPTVTGVTFNRFHQSRSEHVAVLGKAAASRLHISQLNAQPAIFINGTAFTVVGIITETQQLPGMLLGIMVPSTTAAALYPPPDPVTAPAQMIVQTRIGAAQLIAHQAPAALRPDNPSLLQTTAPPDPHSLRDSVNTDLAAIFLALAAVSLVIGTVGIANTTLVAVLERTGEIGLRRSLGARPIHIATQFMSESTVIGAFGGLIGTALGIVVALAVAFSKNWTAVLNPELVLPAPLIGAAVGMLAGIYPAVRAATTEPLEALRR